MIFILFPSHSFLQLLKICVHTMNDGCTINIHCSTSMATHLSRAIIAPKPFPTSITINMQNGAVQIYCAKIESITRVNIAMSLLEMSIIDQAFNSKVRDEAFLQFENVSFFLISLTAKKCKNETKENIAVR